MYFKSIYVLEIDRIEKKIETFNLVFEIISQLEKFDDCELALTEANSIDSEEPEVWAYLCLLNLSLERYDEFSQCYRQMIKVRQNAKILALYKFKVLKCVFRTSSKMKNYMKL